MNYNKDNRLLFAVLDSNLPLMEMLLEDGIGVDAVDDEGNNAVMIAVKLRDESALNLLCDYNVNVMVSDNNGRSPLEVAEYENYDELVDILNEKLSHMDDVSYEKMATNANATNAFYAFLKQNCCNTRKQ